MICLNVARTGVTDLTPLKGMSLQVLAFEPETITKGLDVVRSMGSIRLIGTRDFRLMKPDVFWRKYDPGEPLR